MASVVFNREHDGAVYLDPTDVKDIMPSEIAGLKSEGTVIHLKSGGAYYFAESFPLIVNRFLQDFNAD